MYRTKVKIYFLNNESNRRKTISWTMMAYAFNPSTWKSQTEKYL